MKQKQNSAQDCTTLKGVSFPPPPFQLWLSLAALCVIDEEHAEDLSSGQWLGQDGKPKAKVSRTKVSSTVTDPSSHKGSPLPWGWGRGGAFYYRWLVTEQVNCNYKFYQNLHGW